MLVLERRDNESVIITAPDGTRLTITLTACRNGKAKVCIDAPRDWPILREELAADFDPQDDRR